MVLKGGCEWSVQNEHQTKRVDMGTRESGSALVAPPFVGKLSHKKKNARNNRGPESKLAVRKPR
jgi:hypothetical protein